MRLGDKTGTVVLRATATSKNSVSTDLTIRIVEESKAELKLKTGTYITDDGLAWIELQEDNKYNFNRSVATSWNPVGDYIIQDNTLILYLEDEEFAIFIIEDDYLIFQSDMQGGLSMTEYGTVFRFDE